jgi:hypothetical protein
LTTVSRKKRCATVTLAVAVLAHFSCAVASDRAPLGQVSDEEFWTLSTSLSEPPGAFVHGDALVSNELQFAQLAQRLRPRSGVYVGVGPEQNFSYIARLEPSLAFIVDIRQETRNLHLMYKALFEISADRAEFVTRLFSRARPVGAAGVTSAHRHAPIEDLFAGISTINPSPELYEETRQLIRTQLIVKRGLPLSSDDLRAIDDTLNAFLQDGPDIHYGRALPDGAAWPSYRALMTARDFRGRMRSYLATEDAFGFVKRLQARNAIVPVIGDFAGPTALRRVGDYVRRQQMTVSAFYGSNVEVYLTRDQRRTFCASLATMPHDARTWFVTGKALEPLPVKLNACAGIAPSLHWPPVTP